MFFHTNTVILTVRQIQQVFLGSSLSPLRRNWLVLQSRVFQCYPSSQLELSKQLPKAIPTSHSHFKKNGRQQIRRGMDNKERSKDLVSRMDSALEKGGQKSDALWDPLPHAAPGRRRLPWMELISRELPIKSKSYKS